MSTRRSTRGASSASAAPVVQEAAASSASSKQAPTKSSGNSTSSLPSAPAAPAAPSALASTNGPALSQAISRKRPAKDSPAEETARKVKRTAPASGSSSGPGADACERLTSISTTIQKTLDQNSASISKTTEGELDAQGSALYRSNANMAKALKGLLPEVNALKMLIEKHGLDAVSGAKSRKRLKKDDLADGEKSPPFPSVADEEAKIKNVPAFRRFFDNDMSVRNIVHRYWLPVLPKQEGEEEFKPLSEYIKVADKQSRVPKHMKNMVPKDFLRKCVRRDWSYLKLLMAKIMGASGNPPSSVTPVGIDSWLDNALQEESLASLKAYMDKRPDSPFGATVHNVWFFKSKAQKDAAAAQKAALEANQQT